MTAQALGLVGELPDRGIALRLRFHRRVANASQISGCRLGARRGGAWRPFFLSRLELSIES